MGVAFLYGVIICPIITFIFYIGSGGTGVRDSGLGFMEGLYPVIRFGLIIGVLFGFIFAVITGMLFRPFKSIVFFRDEDSFLSALDMAMGRINYELYKRDGVSYIFREKRGKLAGISVMIRDNKAIIYGHFNKVKSLKKYLSGQSPLNKR